MYYRHLSDAVVVIHLLWILFLIFGSLPGRKIRAIKILHMAGLAFALILQVFGWYCPLTYLEIWLKAQAGASLAYSGSFITHYIEKLVYIELPGSAVLLATVLLTGLHGVLYRKMPKETKQIQ